MSLDLKGKTLRLATNNIPPYVLLKHNENTKKWTGYAGLDYKVIEVLSQVFNFTIEIIECGFKWGQKLPNNTWDGIIGKVLYNEADIGAGTVVLTFDRFKAISILYPHITESVTFSSPVPKVYINSVSLFAPFDYFIWITLLISSTILYLTSKLIENLTKQQIRNFFWSLISAINKQSFNRRINKSSKVRLLFYSWLLSSMVLTTSYGGCLYSLMTFPKNSKPIETIYELADSIQNNDIKVISVGAAAHCQEIIKTKSGVVGVIGKNLHPVQSPPKALELLKSTTDKYGYIDTRVVLDFGLRRHNISNYFIPSPSKNAALYLLNAGIVIPKGFSYEKQFNKILSDIRKSGLLQIWRKQFYYSIFKFEFYKFDLSLLEYNQYKPLNLYQFKNIFVIVILGWLVSFILDFAQNYNNTLN